MALLFWVQTTDYTYVTYLYRGRALGKYPLRIFLYYHKMNWRFYCTGYFPKSRPVHTCE
jgi:hypothetical protein